jgi:electron transfer flavoprotein alpha/beta subunit
MKVITLVKQILDPRGITVRRDKERIFVNREDYIIDPASKAAIEAALQIEAGEDKTVLALSMGEPRADDALREALAMGCDAAHLLSDPAFAQADVSVTAHVLAAAIRKLGGADLIVAGCAAGDSGAGQIGPCVAEALGYAQVTEVYELVVEREALRAKRRWDAGYATVQVPLPAVVTVATEAFPPRYPHGAGIMSAYRQSDVPVWSAADLELTEAEISPLLAFRGESFPPPLMAGEQFRGDPSSVADEVVTALKLARMIG